ncbi:MAG: purine-nucleoside phosphorylase [Chitinophagia bacterium]|jgi:purine-nucleoside phosphorylase
MNEMDKIREAVAHIRTTYGGSYDSAVILGSGLGGFSDEVEIDQSISYADIPHFPVSTVEGHGGNLLIGRVQGKGVLVMSGRFHFYEGYGPLEVVFPIRVLHLLGVKNLYVSNAAGGVNPGFKVGDLMIIKDHISMSIVNPLLGKNLDELGPRFPDMSEPYSKAMIKKAYGIAAKEGYDIKEGVYFGVTGPTFETRAEYKMIHLLGADAVGMSTVQEVIAAVHCGMNVFAMSVITDLGIREEENVITHQEVLDAANAAAPKLSAIIKQMILQ